MRAVGFDLLLTLLPRLALEDNSRNGVTMKFTEPPEARKPNLKWRFYVYKGKESKGILQVHKRS